MSPSKEVWVSKGCPPLSVHAAGKVNSAERGEAISFRCDGPHITRSVPSSFFLARLCGSQARYSDSSLLSAFIPACPERQPEWKKNGDPFEVKLKGTKELKGGSGCQEGGSRQLG